MLFVIKATGPTDEITWLTPANADQVRTLGPRSEAQVFHTRTDAALAIAQMPQPLKTAGVTFSVEFAD
jgi:hypothetical protein